MYVVFGVGSFLWLVPGVEGLICTLFLFSIRTLWSLQDEGMNDHTHTPGPKEKRCRSPGVCRRYHNKIFGMVSVSLAAVGSLIIGFIQIVIPSCVTSTTRNEYRIDSTRFDFEEALIVPSSHWLRRMCR
jgi:hypothetical protein